jgi:hypothetical protein
MKLMGLLASLGLASALLFVSADGAEAASSRHQAAHARAHAQHYARTNRHSPRRYAARRGGYHGKMTLNEILYGPAGMPAAPHDFGPHFDYPPEPLNGGITSSPYLH